MRLEYLMSGDLPRIKEKKIPIVIPIGTIEYHGPHCALGCDTLVCQGVLEKLEAKKEIVIAPPVWYGVASYAVGGPENGTVHIDVDVFEQYVYNILKSMLYGGFKNIYLLIHHQYEEGTLMPMTLACMKAAKKLTMEYLEDTQGQGWWGSNRMAGYYDNLTDPSENPFNWIKTLPVMAPSVQHATGYDHAGKFESSILRALYPSAVKIERLPESDAWFIQSAGESSLELGLRMVNLSVEDLMERIK
ncbi:MAG: creatininase family protein [Clostridiales bacterium]|jgi:creatinine amidohydrolase/Fe(II)-dependent formamide hydrolase-like protein|nr:creatininase family protein [Clostridiales bacterium]